MKDNLFVYILITLFTGFGIYWAVCTYKTDKKEIALSNSPMNTSHEAFTKDAFQISIRGKIYYDLQTYKTNDAINANYLIDSCLKNEIIKYDKQDFLNDSIIKNIFNHVNNALKQEYPGMYWSHTLFYIPDPEYFKQIQEYKYRLLSVKSK